MYARDSIHHRCGRNDTVSLNLLIHRARTKVNTKGNGRRGMKSRKLGKEA